MLDKTEGGQSPDLPPKNVTVKPCPALGHSQLSKICI